MDKESSKNHPKASQALQKAEAREARLKDALRANLRRRKGQVRARRALEQPEKD